MTPRRHLVTAAVALSACALVACGSSGGSKSGSSSTSASSRTPSTSSGDRAMTTAWVDVTQQWRAIAPSSMSTNPQQVAEDLAALRRGQGTSDVGEVSVEAVHKGEPAVVVLAETGGSDPAVVKLETEITLEAGEGGWTVGTARQRATCYQAPEPGATTCPPVSG